MATGGRAAAESDERAFGTGAAGPALDLQQLLLCSRHGRGQAMRRRAHGRAHSLGSCLGPQSNQAA